VSALLPTLSDVAHVLGWVGVGMIVAVVLGGVSAVFERALGGAYITWPSDAELAQRAKGRPVLHIATRKDGAR